MRNNNDNIVTIANSQAPTAESVIRSITSKDAPEHLREHLRSLMDVYFLQPEENMDYPKEVIYSSFLILDNTLKTISDITKGGNYERN